MLTPDAPTDGRPGARPIRGWLLVLSRVLVIWEPLEFAVAAFGAFNAVAVRGWPVLAVLGARLVGAAFSVAAGRGLSDRQPSAPSMATGALAVTGATRLVAYLTPYFPTNLQPGQTPVYVALTMLYYGGCIAYLTWSRQVKALRDS